jgi:hypothetical protein|tara:strand:+ start:9765 stop:10193 length:429 start_codon:yes stop_codon:yes gene_type:complete
MKELNTIIEIVNQISGIDIRVQKRESHYVYSRAVYYKLARMHTSLTLSEIAKPLKKNHATVLHGIRHLFDEVLLGAKNYKADGGKYIEYYNKINNILKRELHKSQRHNYPQTYYRQRFAETLIKLRLAEQKLRACKKEKIEI